MARDEPITVTIWSDVVCPFCNVARERADWLRREANVEIAWLPFDLHPEYPPEGIARDDLMRRYPASLHEAVRAMHEDAKMPYNPHPERVPNTRRALELIEWGRAQGVHDALHERIMDAYWTEGRDITGWDELGPCVADVGLDPAEAQAQVDSGACHEAVSVSTATARRHGISGVPALVFDGRLLVSGAQPHETLGRALEQVAMMRVEENTSNVG